MVNLWFCAIIWRSSKIKTKMRLKAFLQRIGVMASIVVMTLLSVSSNQYVSTNVLSVSGIVEDADAFAAVEVMYPIKEVLNWVETPREYWAGNYNDVPAEYFMPLPDYDTGLLVEEWSSLDLTDEDDREVYNLKKTYPAVFMGNYKLDGKEYVGSHTGIDIRSPIGTPVYAFASGKVVVAKNQDFGFGNHVVIKHENVPSFEDSRLKVNYYSGYAHLSELSVEVGDEVTVGALVGRVGSTGASSTPHLHFQLDNEQAPLSPYWPINAKILREKKISFVEAINEGVGKDEALKYVVHPFNYIKKYHDGEFVFNDVAIDDENGPEIKFLKDKLVVKGYPDGSFRPYSKVSRAEVLKMIALSKKEVEKKDSNVRRVVFNDVITDAWYTPYVAQAYTDGIVNGYPDGSFRPEQEVLGVEFLKMLLNSFENEEGFVPGSNEIWYTAYLEQAERAGLLDDDVNYLEPIDRQEVAAILYRQLQLLELQ